MVIADRAKEPITIDSKHIAVAHTISTSQLNMLVCKLRLMADGQTEVKIQHHHFQQQQPPDTTELLA